MSPHHETLSNQQLAAIFERIASLLEIKGEVVFKTRAYTRAAESLRSLGEEAQTLAGQGRLGDIPGVGKAIAEKIEELLETGRLGFLERLESEVPPTLLELLEIPDVGPRKAAMFWKQLGIVDRAGLEAAARAGKLRDLPGMGEKSEARIIAGIAAVGRRSDRMTLELARSQAQHWLAWLSAQPGVIQTEAGGSLRRWKETVGDLDLVAACSPECNVLENLANHPDVERVMGRGDNKVSVVLKNGTRMQVWISSPERFGSLLLYAAGSKNHNVHLREMALKRSLSLSDRGLEAPDGSIAEYATEEALYAEFGLPWIPPELREDRGEIEAALKGRLPRLVEVDDIQMELHTHSTWSDGALAIREMAQAAVQRGYKVLAVTDHSGYMGITGGLKPETLPDQRAEIEQVRKEFDGRLIILHGIEVDITAAGALALPDESLAELDLVIASLHVSLRQPKETVTNRLLTAIHNPHVDIIAHPSGRLLPNREGADLDWEAVLAAAKETGVALEINASPHRLDLNDVYARRAVEMGIPLTINTDAHSDADLELLPYGVSVARRAWVGKESILNTWAPEKLLSWLKQRG